MNKNTVYIVGGSEYDPSLLPRKYNVMKSCLKVNIETEELVQCPDLLTGRYNHELCGLGAHLFVIGG